MNVQLQEAHLSFVLQLHKGRGCLWCLAACDCESGVFFGVSGSVRARARARAVLQSWVEIWYDEQKCGRFGVTL